MIFSSITFLYLFLPVALILYFLPKQIKYKNYILIFLSLTFYTWGEPIWVSLLIFSSIVDYFHGILAEKYKNSLKGKLTLISSITINLNIEFEYNSDKFIGNHSYKLLDKVFNLLNSDVNMLLEIQGHTDNIGTKEYNKILSKNRALNVLNYLTEKGIAPNRMISFGFGETKPISKNNNNKGTITKHTH